MMDNVHSAVRSMFAKLVVVALLLAIVATLFSGLFFLMKDSNNSKRTVKALTFRVLLSLTLIVFLVVAAGMGWIHPHSLTGR
jgi:succinate dehydrogenase/fumarate reductase cytochrome b subunit